MVSDEVYGGIWLCYLEESECKSVEGVMVVVCGWSQGMPYAGVEESCVWRVRGCELLETGCEVGIHAGGCCRVFVYDAHNNNGPTTLHPLQAAMSADKIKLINRGFSRKHRNYCPPRLITPRRCTTREMIRIISSLHLFPPRPPPRQR